MCGIVAAIAERSVQSILIEGLKRLSIADMTLQVSLWCILARLNAPKLRARSLSSRNWYLIQKRVRVLLIRGGLLMEFPASEMRTPTAPEDSRSYTTALLKITRPSKFALYRMGTLSNPTPIQKQLHIFFILQVRQRNHLIASLILLFLN